MSDLDHPPIDAFADLDLAEFKNAKPQARPLNPAPKMEKEAIRAAAEKGEFISRQPVTRKQKIVPKTFSLFQDECDIINAALKAYQAEPDERLSQPSSSDVARAALHVFAALTPEEQVSYIKENRGRGRK
jgi:hypothetical protein